MPSSTDGSPRTAFSASTSDPYTCAAISAHVHRMRQDSDTPAVSIHAYSPPLWRMGSYAVNPDGTLRRQSISYAEELRPAESIG